MGVYQIVIHLHSVLRYVALFFILLSIINSLNGFIHKSAYTKSDSKFSLITLSIFHTQALLGLVLYFLSPKVLFMHSTMSSPMLRFFTVEHIGGMVAAVILITIGYSKAKRAATEKGHKTLVLYYFIATILVFVSIPWPFMTSLGSKWF